MRRDGYDVVVIGAGLVGGAIAYGLARAGQRVAVLDEEDATYRASRGNFGLVWVQGKGAGRPEYALWSRASSERWFALSDALVEDCGLPPHYGRPGGVIPALSDDELSGLDSMLAGLRQAAGNAGYDYEMLDATRVRELLPACGPEVAGGAYSPYDGHANPLQLMRGLHASHHPHLGRAAWSVVPCRQLSRMSCRDRRRAEPPSLHDRGAGGHAGAPQARRAGSSGMSEAQAGCGPGRQACVTEARVKMCVRRRCGGRDAGR